MYNLQTDYGLTVVEREHSDLTHNVQTDYGHTVVEREHSDLTYNYHKWSLTICDGCFDTLKSSKMRS